MAALEPQFNFPVFPKGVLTHSDEEKKPYQTLRRRSETASQVGLFSMGFAAISVVSLSVMVRDDEAYLGAFCKDANFIDFLPHLGFSFFSFMLGCSYYREKSFTTPNSFRRAYEPFLERIKREAGIEGTGFNHSDPTYEAELKKMDPAIGGSDSRMLRYPINFTYIDRKGVTQIKNLDFYQIDFDLHGIREIVSIEFDFLAIIRCRQIILGRRVAEFETLSERLRTQLAATAEALAQAQALAQAPAEAAAEAAAQAQAAAKAKADRAEKAREKARREEMAAERLKISKVKLDERVSRVSHSFSPDEEKRIGYFSSELHRLMSLFLNKKGRLERFDTTGLDHDQINALKRLKEFNDQAALNQADLDILRSKFSDALELREIHKILTGILNFSRYLDEILRRVESRPGSSSGMSRVASDEGASESKGDDEGISESESEHELEAVAGGSGSEDATVGRAGAGGSAGAGTTAKDPEKRLRPGSNGVEVSVRAVSASARAPSSATVVYGAPGAHPAASLDVLPRPRNHALVGFPVGGLSIADVSMISPDDSCWVAGYRRLVKLYESIKPAELAVTAPERMTKDLRNEFAHCPALLDQVSAEGLTWLVGGLGGSSTDDGQVRLDFLRVLKTDYDNLSIADKALLLSQRVVWLSSAEETDLEVIKFLLAEIHEMASSMVGQVKLYEDLGWSLEKDLENNLRLARNYTWHIQSSERSRGLSFDDARAEKNFYKRLKTLVHVAFFDPANEMISVVKARKLSACQSSSAEMQI